MLGLLKLMRLSLILLLMGLSYSACNKPLAAPGKAAAGPPAKRAGAASTYQFRNAKYLRSLTLSPAGRTRWAMRCRRNCRWMARKAAMARS